MAVDSKIAAEIANSVRKFVGRKLPGAYATGIANGKVGGGTAFGVAVPEVEIIVFASPSSLLKRIQSCQSEGDESRKLQKAAVRFCTQELVSSGAFKFRRSSFRGVDPKVTLVAPVSLGVCDQAVPVDVFVNSHTPLRNAMLLEECARIDTRSRDLILFVRSWAKARGICHAAKGHLSPYAWTLLVIFYLQVGVPEEGPILPALESLDLENPTRMFGLSTPPERSSTVAKTSIGSLFYGFIGFYARDAAWCKGALAAHLGRKVPLQRLPSDSMVWHEDGRFELLPTIQDPFEPSMNVASSASAVGMERLREELARARGLIGLGASVDGLLEPWSPRRQDWDA